MQRIKKKHNLEKLVNYIHDVCSIENLKRGNKVLTAGGILGVISKANEGSETVSVEISKDVIVDVARQMISEVRGEEKVKNTDTKSKGKAKTKK